jgi:hypothetical protein
MHPIVAGFPPFPSVPEEKIILSLENAKLLQAAHPPFLVSGSLRMRAVKTSPKQML